MTDDKQQKLIFSLKQTLNDTTMTDVKEKVLSELRSRKIKLWLSPYCENGISKQGTLKLLSSRLTKETESLVDYQEDDVFKSLQELQLHALAKLAEKKRSINSNSIENGESSPIFPTERDLPNLELKVFGLKNGDVCKNKASFPDWAEGIEFEEKLQNGNVVMNLKGISSQLPVSQFIEQLKTGYKVSQVRLLYKGKFLQHSESDTLGSQLLRNGDAQLDNNATLSLMCLVSGEHDNTSTELATLASSLSISPEERLIKSVRRAATSLHDNSQFEITDQHGRHVPMSKHNRVSFLTALGLHRLGRKHMPSNASSALTFLLEADQEWSLDLQREWGSRVDNYGLLQLDICWVYLQLESLSALPDVLRRLDVAERVLKNQVHKNFVALAVAQAENGNSKAVPPLAAIFVRLFLLQGVAYKFENSGTATNEKSNERLHCAGLLCQSLRSVATEEDINRLGEAVGATKFAAISALRRSNGDVNVAAGLIEDDEKKVIEEDKMRNFQRRIGLCANLSDYVAIDKIPQLKNVLNLNEGGMCDTQTDVDQMMKFDLSTELVVGLLRLTNNDMDKSIDLYQEMNLSGGVEMILNRVGELDKHLKGQGLMASKFTKKRKRPREKNEKLVDDVGLATLVSMDVDEALGREALKATDNNVESALIWITQRSSETKQQVADQTDPMDTDMKEIDGGEEDDDANIGDDENGNSDDDGDDANSGDGKNGNSGNDSITDKVTAEQAKIEADLKKAMEERYRMIEERRRRRAEDMEALALLERELGEALQERDMEKDYLGSSLEEEWQIINKYR